MNRFAKQVVYIFSIIIVLFLGPNSCYGQTLAGIYSGPRALTTFAIWDDDTMFGWGSNDGRIGDGVGSYRSTPVFVSGSWQHACAAFSASCFVTNTGGLMCTGSNDEGQLGNGDSQSFRFTPVASTGYSSGVSRVACGYAHICALLDDQSLRCWGRNDRGMLGSSTTSTKESTPVSYLTSLSMK